MMNQTIVRIPPSPTGHLHLGTARTALFNYLFACQTKGAMIFRWEDTDRERSESKFESEILEGLKWLGMDFETCSTIKRQTENTELHQATLQKLWEADKIFPCFVTSEDIDQMRESARAAKQNFTFWSPFRDTDRLELISKMEAGESFVWRIRTPKDKLLTVKDAVTKDVTVSSNTLGDFTVARKDGSVLYLLANVTDDLDQGVTHVIRGADHISNTPKQLLLWEALGHTPPAYAHIPLVLDHQKRKLSKRNVEPDVCVLVKDFQAQGFVPEAVINGLAFLGWNPKSTEEIFSLKNLEEIFSLEAINAAAAQYDFEKMKWFNGQWLNRLELSEVMTRFCDWLEVYDSENLEKYTKDKDQLAQIIAIVRQKSKTFTDFRVDMAYFFEDLTIDKNLLVKEKMKVDTNGAQAVLEALVPLLEGIEEADFTAENIKVKSIEKIAAMELKNGQFLWPFRVALSGAERSAGPFEMAEIFGKTESLKRIEAYQS